MLAGQRVARLAEFFEHELLLFGSDTDARIADGEDHLRPISLCFEEDAAPFRRKFDGVG